MGCFFAVIVVVSAVFILSKCGRWGRGYLVNSALFGEVEPDIAFTVCLLDYLLQLLSELRDFYLKGLNRR